MPHISVKMYPGRTNKEKKRFVQELKTFTTQTLGCDAKYVSVSIKEIEAGQWKETMKTELIDEEIMIEADF